VTPRLPANSRAATERSSTPVALYITLTAVIGIVATSLLLD
jgi:hypothetical protein